MPVTWDVGKKQNVKWVAALGSQTYGNPVVSDGKVFVGTNNEGLRDPKQAGDRGVLMAFRESDGEFLWQSTHEKLAAGRVNDWPYQGVCSSPLVEGKKLYYVSNRCELLCVDTEGFRDGENNGPYKEEKLTGQFDVDILWKFDMIEEVGAHPHNMANSAPVSFGDLIYISTSNGQDESHVNVPSPKAPSIVAISKTTGKLVWEDNSVGERILHGQWASPTVGKIGGVDQVIMGQGDGWIRGYEALTGKKLWEFDSNPKDSVWPKTRNEMISTAVIYDEKVYVANGQDPEHGEGVGHLYCIDATKRGDITTTGRSGTTTRFAAPFPRRRSTMDSSTILTSADSCIVLTQRQDRRSGCTICSQPCGDRRCWRTARFTWAMKMATLSCCRPAERKRCWLK